MSLKNTLSIKLNTNKIKVTKLLSFQQSPTLAWWKYSGSTCCISTLLMPDLPLTRLPLYACLVLSCPVFVVPGVRVLGLLCVTSALYSLLSNRLPLVLEAVFGPRRNTAGGKLWGLLNKWEYVEEACPTGFFSETLVKSVRKQLLQSLQEIDWAHHYKAPKPGPLSVQYCLQTFHSKTNNLSQVLTRVLRKSCCEFNHFGPQ